MPIVPDRKQLFKEEIAACADSFDHFCQYLKIRDRKGEIVPLVLKSAQIKVIEELEKNPYLAVLKARQLGSSTVIAAYFFWKALTTPEYRTIVVAHTNQAVGNIFAIYNTFYKNLPSFLQFKTEAASAHELRFFHGGSIKVSSASSESFRGTTYSALHLSECAFWKNIPKTIASLFQCATADNAFIILETTANGLNDFYNFWNDENGFTKLFMSWTLEPEYETKDDTYAKPQQLLDYAKEWNLTKRQLNWAAKTLAINCGNSWVTFLQEYAIDPVTCFASSGDRFFKETYPHAEFNPGYIKYEEPSHLCAYTIGVDTASGSVNGDYSCFCVMKFTGDGTKPVIVATWAGIETPIAFSNRVWRECKIWNATAVVELNACGVVVVEYLRHKGWARLYTRQVFDQVSKSWTETLGWVTSGQTRMLLLTGLKDAIDSGELVPNDERLQYQINTMIFDEKGRPNHANGTHDDMIFATALALMGRTQISIDFYEHRPNRPTTMEDVIKTELATGKTLSQLDEQNYWAPQSWVE